MEKHVIFLLGMKPVGRRGLAQLLGSTEMKTRSLLNDMHCKGLITFEKQGCVLASKGKSAYKKISSLITEVKELDFGPSALDKVCVCAGLKKEPALPSWQVRDFAVRAGATGAFVLSKNKNWHLQGMAESFSLNLQGSHAIACFASTREKATHALWAALSELL